MSAKIAIVQRILPEYRVALLDEMRAFLDSENIALSLYYGQEIRGSTPASVKIERTWLQKYKNIYLNLGNFSFII